MSAITELQQFGTNATPSISEHSSRARKKKNFPVLCSNPAFQSKAKLNDRVLSFQDCSASYSTSLIDYCKAGFFRVDSLNKLRCYNCGGSLQEWRPPDEDPFYEHAKWFPGCEYIQKYMGVEYVTEVMREHPDLNRPAIHNPVSLSPVLSHVEQTFPENLPELFASLDERVDVEMMSEIVKSVIMLGFNSDLVRTLIKKKLENDDAGYQTMLALVEDLHNEDCDETTMNSEPAMPSFVRPPAAAMIPPSTSSAPRAPFIADFCFFKIAVIPRF